MDRDGDRYRKIWSRTKTDITVIGVIGRVSPESKLRLRRGGVNNDDENDYDYDYVYTTVATATITRRHTTSGVVRQQTFRVVTGELPVVTRRRLCSRGSGDARQTWPPSAPTTEKRKIKKRESEWGREITAWNILYLYILFSI